jgi:hypothetical protein
MSGPSCLGCWKPTAIETVIAAGANQIDPAHLDHMLDVIGGDIHRDIRAAREPEAIVEDAEVTALLRKRTYHLVGLVTLAAHQRAATGMGHRRWPP